MSIAAAEVAQPGEEFWYLDEADVLSLDTEGEIFFANQRLYDACGAEIVVVAIDSTDGMAIDDYAYTLFNDWEIGGSKYLGFLFLMAIEDEDYYAMPGTMMGTYFDSASISDMLQIYVEPDFADGDYDAAARAFFEAMYAETVDKLNLNLSIKDAKADYEAFMESEKESTVHSQQQTVRTDVHPAGKGGISLGTIILIALLLIVLIRTTKRFHRRSAVHTPPPIRFTPSPSPRRRSTASSMMTGYILGRMAGSRNGFRREPRNIPNVSGTGMRRGMNRSSFGGNRSGGFAGRSSGVGRSGASGSFGGFGSASRSGGMSRGPATRGGGAGRFSRK